MFMAGLFTGRVTGQIIRLQANLRGQKARNCQGNDFTGCQQTTGISQGAQVDESKAETVVWTASGADDFQVIVRQRVMMQHLGLNGRQIEQCCALPVGQNCAMCHISFSFRE
jgi:hypothetical protein